MPTTTGLASLATNPASQTLLPLPALVTAIAQSTTSSVERALDQHFTHLLRQQQQLVSAVQQLARPQAAVSLPSLLSNPPTELARGPLGNITPQSQILPAAILRSIPLIASTPTTINPLFHLASSMEGNSRTSVPSGIVATPIPAIGELPGTTTPVVLASSTPPIPPKLAERIWRGEYVAVSELLPERLTEPPIEIKKDDKRKATKPILLIASWSLEFSVYIHGSDGSEAPRKSARLCSIHGPNHPGKLTV